MRTYSTKEEAEELLKDAEKSNPGAWAEHSRIVAKCSGFADVKQRYGSYPQEKWDANMGLKILFEAKYDKDIYEIVRAYVRDVFAG